MKKGRDVASRHQPKPDDATRAMTHTLRTVRRERGIDSVDLGSLLRRHHRRATSRVWDSPVEGDDLDRAT